MNAIIGDNGIITQATNAKIEAENAAIKERVDQILVEAYGKEFDSKEDFITWVNEQFQKEGLEATLQDDDNGYALVYGKDKKIIEYLSEDLGRSGEGGTMVAVTGSTDEWDYVTQEGTNKVKLTAYKGTDKNITIPNIVDGNLVSAIGGGIFGAYSDGNGRNVEEINFSDGLIEIDAQSFMNNKNLIKIGNFPKSLRTIGKESFKECSNLVSELSLPNTLKSVGEYAFYNCNKMPAEVENILRTTTSYGLYAFGYCSSISGDIATAMDVLISDDETVIPEYIFSGMSGLTGTITIGENIEEIGQYAFYGCSGLTGIDISDAKNLEIIGDYSFQETRYLGGNLNFGNSLHEIGTNAFYYSGDLSATGFENLYMPSSLNRVGYQAFRLSGVRNVVFDCGDVFELGGSDNRSYAFAFCTKLVSSGYDKGCDMSCFPVQCFRGSSRLSQVNISSSFSHVGESAFEGTGLVSIKLPGNVVEVDSNAFRSCTLLEKIEFSEGLETIRSDAFNSCPKLKSLPLREYSNMIDETGNLIPGQQVGLLSSLQIIENSAFNLCSLLGYVDEGDHRTNLITLLKNSSITSIGVNAFAGCPYLTGAYDDTLSNCKIENKTQDGVLITTRMAGNGTKITLNNSFESTNITKAVKFELASRRYVDSYESLPRRYNVYGLV